MCGCSSDLSEGGTAGTEGDEAGEGATHRGPEWRAEGLDQKLWVVRSQGMFQLGRSICKEPGLHQKKCGGFDGGIGGGKTRAEQISEEGFCAAVCSPGDKA